MDAALAPKPSLIQRITLGVRNALPWGNSRLAAEDVQAPDSKPPVTEPKRKPTQSELAPELPVRDNYLAGGAPEWHDAVPDDLNADAYRIIRTTPATLQPINKLAKQVGSRRVVVNGDEGSELVPFLQKCWDNSKGVASILRWLAWAHGAEGLRYSLLKSVWAGDIAAFDFRRCGRLKAKAGGVLSPTADGQIVKETEYATSRSVTEEQRKTQPMPRNRFVAYRPGGGSNPEGDTELAWALLNIAIADQRAEKNWELIHDRQAIGTLLLRKSNGNARADQISSIRSSDAEKLATMQGRMGVVNLPPEALVEALKPNIAGHQMSRERREHLAFEAHKLVLDNVLSSNVADTERGNTAGHIGEEALAVACVCADLGETLTDDANPFIIAENERMGVPVPKLKPGERQPWLTLEPPSEASRISPDVLAQMRKDDVLDTEWYYEQRQAPRPDGLEDTLEPAVQPSPFGMTPDEESAMRDGDGLVGEDEERDNKPAPKRVAARAKLAKKPRQLTESAQLVALSQERLAPEFTKYEQAVASGWSEGTHPAFPVTLANEIAKVKALGDIAGRARMARSLKTKGIRLDAGSQSPTLVFETSVKLPFNEAIADFSTRTLAPIVGEAGAATAAQQVAQAYARHQFAAAHVIEEGLLAEVKIKLDIFLREGEGGISEFGKWFKTNVPDAGEAYAETVFRNNVNRSYNAGQQQQAKQAAPFIAGLRYETAGDDAVRPSHAALHGTVLPIDAPQPPYDHNCRCTTVPIAKDEGEAVSVGELDQRVNAIRSAEPGALAFFQPFGEYGA
jgi:SPP1 gp7 family putative phage head morphogenesis protein